MKATMGKLAPVFNTNRMVRQYAEKFYAPVARRWDELTADGMAQAKQLSAWRSKLRERFGNVRIESVSDNMDSLGAHVGKDVRVEAVVDLGGLEPQDIQVELYFGSLDEDGQLSEGRALPMQQVGHDDDHRLRFAVEMPCTRSGMTGYTVRVQPSQAVLPDSREAAMIRWA